MTVINMNSSNSSDEDSFMSPSRKQLKWTHLDSTEIHSSLKHELIKVPPIVEYSSIYDYCETKINKSCATIGSESCNSSFVVNRIANPSINFKVPLSLANLRQVKNGSLTQNLQFSLPSTSTQSKKSTHSPQFTLPSTSTQSKKSLHSPQFSLPSTSTQSKKSPHSAQFSLPSTSTRSKKSPHSPQFLLPSTSTQYKIPPHSPQFSLPSTSTQSKKSPHSAQFSLPSTSTQYKIPPHSPQFSLPSTSTQSKISLHSPKDNNHLNNTPFVHFSVEELSLVTNLDRWLNHKVRASGTIKHYHTDDKVWLESVAEVGGPFRVLIKTDLLKELPPVDKLIQIFGTIEVIDLPAINVNFYRNLESVELFHFNTAADLMQEFVPDFINRSTTVDASTDSYMNDTLDHFNLSSYC